jgi:hypothetical protein
MPLTPVIAGQGSSAYRQRVIAAFSRLLALLALVLMPVGMGAAPAAAHAPQVAAEAGHCGDAQQGAPDAPPVPAADCTVGCAAVAAPAPAQAAATLLPKETPATALIAAITGMEPDIATPPPKRA